MRTKSNMSDKSKYAVATISNLLFKPLTFIRCHSVGFCYQWYDVDFVVKVFHKLHIKRFQPEEGNKMLSRNKVQHAYIHIHSMGKQTQSSPDAKKIKKVVME